jgi:uncharacterized protein (UPF0335 family)
MQDEIQPDIADVMSEEKSRGRRRVDTKAREERRTLRADIRKFIHEGDERGFIDAVRARGFKEGSPEFREILELFWAETRRPSKPPRGKP